MLSTLSTAALATLCVMVERSAALRRLVVLLVRGGEYVCSPDIGGCSSPDMGMRSLDGSVC